MEKYIMILKKSFACEALFVYRIGSYFVFSYTVKFVGLGIEIYFVT